MRLSEAMMLGEVMLPRNDGKTWLSGYNFYRTPPLQPTCGCAIGRAWLANGGSMENYEMTQSFLQMWPWLTPSITGGISIQFSRVHSGNMTFEQLVDHVRSIEPSCDERCEFECVCKTPAPIETEVPVLSGRG